MKKHWLTLALMIFPRRRRIRAGAAAARTGAANDRAHPGLRHRAQRRRHDGCPWQVSFRDRWDTATGKKLRTFESKAKLHCVALSADGRLFLTGDEQKAAIVWDVATGKKLHTLDEHPSSVMGVAFMPDGKRVVTGSAKDAFLWDVTTGKKLLTFSGHSDGSTGFPSAPTGNNSSPRRIDSCSSGKQPMARTKR